MVNKFQVKRGREGLYRVMSGRALHWPTNNGKPRIWAGPNQYVDLRSPYMCEIAQRTGQMHKLTKVDAVPAGAAFVGDADLPGSVLAAKVAYESGAGAKYSEPERDIDFAQLPSAVEEVEEPELPADPEPEVTPTEEDEPVEEEPDEEEESD